MTMYSHSRLSSFEQCKYRYKLRYLDKVPSPVEKSIEAHLGTCAHDALEWLYTEVLEGKLPTLDEVLEKYTQRWQEDFKDDFIIVKTEFTANDYYNKGVKFILDYYLKHTPFKDGTLELEKRIWVELKKDYPHKFMGYIDRLVYNKETNMYEIHDYKTAKNIPPQYKIDSDRQLAIYSLGVKQLYGMDKEMILTWHYLSHNEQIYSKRTDEQLEKLRLEIIELIEKIENNTEWEPSKGILCNWCEYKTVCKAFGNKLPLKYRHEQQKLFHDITKKEFPTTSKYIKD